MRMCLNGGDSGWRLRERFVLSARGSIDGTATRARGWPVADGRESGGGDGRRHLLRRLPQRRDASPSGALLDQFDTARIADNPDCGSGPIASFRRARCRRSVRARPDRPAYDAVLASIETALGADAAPPADATSQEIADRLALLLWNSAPDASLLQDAQAQPADESGDARASDQAHARRRTRPCLRVALLLPLAGTRSARQSRPGQGVLSRLRRVAARCDGDEKPNCSCSVNCGRTATRSSSGMRTTRS